MKLKVIIRIVVIVCLCRAVSDRTVRLAAQDGARSLKQVAAACGAGRGCGSCHGAIEEIIRTTEARVCIGSPDCLDGSLPVASARATVAPSR